MTEEQARHDQNHYIQVTADNTITVSAAFFRDLYEPAVDQMWYVNECFALEPFAVGWKKDPATGTFDWIQDGTHHVYNFGNALREAGVKVVFGYSTIAESSVIPQNLMPFLRRFGGGYSIKDLPPSPYSYWPTCMTVQTYFRDPAQPAVPNYKPILRGKSLMVMDAVTDGQYFRNACSLQNTHAELQQFILQTGDDADFITDCWDQQWSLGNYPSTNQDPICGQGDNPTTQQASVNAACGVAIARRATNAILDN
jgi:hypothetical protein